MNRVEIESEERGKELDSTSGKSVVTTINKYKEDRELLVALITWSQLKRQQAQNKWEKQQEARTLTLNALKEEEQLKRNKVKKGKKPSEEKEERSKKESKLKEKLGGKAIQKEESKERIS